jgi:hypothetical protein
MLIAEARVATERPGRYLDQLCRHLSQVAQQFPIQANVDWSDGHGVITIGGGRCTLRAHPGVLTVRAEAPDEESLLQLKDRIAGKLEQIGRRDRLTVAWTRQPAVPAEDNEGGIHE